MLSQPARSPVSYAKDAYNVNSTVDPIVGYLFARDKSLSSADRREFRIVGLPAKRTIEVLFGERKETIDQQEVAQKSFAWPLMHPEYSVRNGPAKRTLLRLGRSEIALMSASGHVFVRQAPPPVCAFINEGFLESDFWETINPEFDEPFINEAEAALLPLSFKWGARRLTENTFRDALALIIRAAVENPTQRTISVHCATKNQEPILLGPSSVIDPRTLSGALLDRFIKCSRPLRYQLGSSDGFVNLWASEKTAEQLRYKIELAGDSIVLTSFERLGILEEVRSLFASYRFPIDDIVELVA